MYPLACYAVLPSDCRLPTPLLKGYLNGCDASCVSVPPRRATNLRGRCPVGAPRSPLPALVGAAYMAAMTNSLNC